MIAVGLRTIVVGTYRAVRYVTGRLHPTPSETSEPSDPQRRSAPLLRNVGSLAQFVLAHIVGAGAAIAGAARRFARETGAPAYRSASRRLRTSLSVEAFADPLTGPLMLDDAEGQSEARAAYRSRTGAHPSA
jgi:hypothetical protein